MIIVYVKKGKLMKGIAGLLIFIIVALFSTAVSTRNKTVFSINKKKLPIYCVETKEKKIALTFDASWPEDNTDEILKILDKYNVKATFFVVGIWIDNNEEKLKSIYDKGHEIGNHTNNHPDMNDISSNKLIKEIKLEDEKIQKITGVTTELFRCPSGSYNDNILDTVNSLKKYCIQWDVDSIDWKNQGAKVEYNRVIKNTKPGSIMLFHNDAKFTPENLPRIIEYFQKNGYEFVKVSDLIYKENYIINGEGKQISNK